MTTDADAFSAPPMIFEIERWAAPSDRESVLADLIATLADGAQARGFTDATLFLWTRTVQRDSRLVRAKGFWRTHAHIALRLPQGCSTTSHIVEDADGPRFVASATAHMSELPQLVVTAHVFARLGGLVVLHRHGQAEGDVTAALISALRSSESEYAVLNLLRETGFGYERVAVIPTGRFDDLAVGCLVLAPAEWGIVEPILRDTTGHVATCNT